jgi:hypothetical protein
VATLWITGCSFSSHFATKPENFKGSDQPYISSIDLKDGRSIYFDEELGRAVLEDSSVIRLLPNGAMEKYPMDQILRIHTTQPATVAEHIVYISFLTIIIVLILWAVSGPIAFS